MSARGLRNRNPGNLRHSPAIAWNGELEPDADGFCRFDSVQHGLRALCLDLATKWGRGLTTVRRIIEVYAPPSENPTAVYVTAVCAALGVKPDERIDLSEVGTLALLAKAIVRRECGSFPYTVHDLLRAAQDAAATAEHQRERAHG